MKTVKELRDFITANGGEVVVGYLKFSYVVRAGDNGGGDIDVHFNGKLLQWCSEGTEGETLLSDKSTFVISCDFEDQSETLDRVKKERAELEEKMKLLKEENTTLKMMGTEAGNAFGKVEAYEKVLFGSRKVTLE